MTLANALKSAGASALIGVAATLWSGAACAQSQSWAGFYLGGGLGDRQGQVGWSTDSIYAPIAYPGTGYYDPLVNSDAHLNSNSLRGTFFGGYNWRQENWILGVEADIGIGRSKNTISGTPGVDYFGNTSGDRLAAELGLDGSIRLRGGMLVSPSWLFYGTGGLALQQAKLTSTCGPQASPTFCNFGVGLGAMSESATRTLAGWTLGGGVEAALGEHWTLRGEYRYSQFGSVNQHFFSGNPQLQWTGAASINTHILNVGLAYKF